mgnify:CR=1 FL=1
MNTSILWFRRDLRLHDNPALAAALENSRHLVPVYILEDDETGSWPIGEASRWWLYNSLQTLASATGRLGSRLIIRQGSAETLIPEMAADFDAVDVYINEVYAALQAGSISREHFELLTVAINTGTNIPSVATPNGQAAFLFLLTSALAPVIRLGYGRMVILALPYTVTMTIAGLLATIYLL